MEPIRTLAAGGAGGRRLDELELCRALLESLGEGVYVVDRAGRVVLANAAAEQLLGWSRDELAGQPIHDLVHHRRPDGTPLPAEECPLLAVARTGEPVRADDDVFVRRDGSALPVSYSSYPVRSGDEVVGAVVAFRDVTAIKERERRERRARVSAEVLARARALPDSMRVDARADALVHAIAPGLADYATVHLAEPGGIRLVAVAHADPECEDLVREIHARHPPDPKAQVGVPAVIRSARLELHEEIGENVLEATARDDEHLALLRRLDPRSSIVLPLVARGRTLGALTLVSTGGHYSRETAELAEQVAADAALALDNARLFADRSRAMEELQRALLPGTLPSIPGLEVAVRYRPAGRGMETGGDFYDVVDLGEDGFRLLIGDVAGKGAKAAALTGLVRYTVRGAASTGAGAAQVLSLVNDAMLRQGDDGEFCSAVYGTITPGQGRVELCLHCAGHPRPLVLSAGGELRDLEGNGPLLGVATDAGWDDIRLELTPGDLLLLYTDGAVELRGAEPYRGEDQLRELVRGCTGATAAEVVERIEHHVLVANAGEPRDDLALLALRAT